MVRKGMLIGESTTPRINVPPIDGPPVLTGRQTLRTLAVRREEEDWYRQNAMVQGFA